jgi:outer membrane protein assembly factor BamB
MRRVIFLLLIFASMSQLSTARTTYAALSEVPIRCSGKTQFSTRIAGIRDGTVLISDFYGRALFAFDANDCSERWRIDLKDSEEQNAAVLSGSLMVVQLLDFSGLTGNDDGSDFASYQLPGVVEGIDINTGNVVWKTSSKAGYGLNAAVDESIVVLNGAGAIEAFDATSGEMLWNAEPSDSSWFVSSSILAGDLIVNLDSAGSNGADQIVGRERTTGNVRWALRRPNLNWPLKRIRSDYPDQILLAWNDGDSEETLTYVEVIDAHTGESLSAFTFDGVYDPFIGDRALYGSRRFGALGQFAAIDRTSGADLWTVPIQPETIALMEKDGSVITASSAYGDVPYAIDSLDELSGSTDWHTELPGMVSNLAARGPLFVQNSDSLLFLQADRVVRVSLATGEIMYEGLLPMLDQDHIISETGWCPGAELTPELQMASDILVASSCTNVFVVLNLNE